MFTPEQRHVLDVFLISGDREARALPEAERHELYDARRQFSTNAQLRDLLESYRWIVTTLAMSQADGTQKGNAE